MYNSPDRDLNPWSGELHSSTTVPWIRVVPNASSHRGGAQHRATKVSLYRVAMRRIVPAALVGLLLILWWLAPSTTAAALLRVNNLAAGLTPHVVQTAVGPVHYLEGGQGETVVLVHGIYSRKEHWVDMARPLVSRFHVVAIDLPGFGDNPVREAGAYTLPRQLDALIATLDALEIDRSHIAANSMGAQLSGMLAAKHPERIDRLAFIGSPLGVASPTPSEMEQALARGERPLVVRTLEDFDERNRWLFPSQPYVPGPILRTWAAAEVAQAEVNMRIWDEVHDPATTPAWLLELAPSLSMPVLVVWCEEDRIFHVSGAPTLGAALPDGTVERLQGCGHVPMLDAAPETAELLGAFLER